MKLTYYGHACFLLETKGKKLLFDPFITPNELAQGKVDVDTIEADYILLTHGHQDHVADLEPIAKRTGATLISSFEIVTYYGEKGIQGHPMNLGGKYSFDFGTVKFVNAVHSSVLPDGTYAANPGGFVIWNEEGCIYIAGDTALTMDMKLIPMTCPKLTAAVLPIGDNFTMGYKDAAIAADFIECSQIIGCHYDTFGWIKIDPEQAKKSFSDKGKELILLPIGDRLSL
jgi:L-ascorbate metabolism protein UlaG (beta-lactamase superfamily)